MPRTLLVLDIDKTLCCSCPADHLVAEKGIEGWIESMKRGDWTGLFSPTTNSLELVQEFIDCQPDTQILYLSGRREDLGYVTCDWLWADYPFPSANSELYLRAKTDLASNSVSKAWRLENFLYAPDQTERFNLIICDDDPEMRAVAHRNGGKFYQVRDCIWEKDWYEKLE